MSVCFFVPTDQVGSSNLSDEGEVEVPAEEEGVDNTHLLLQQFWIKVMDDIKKTTTDDFKTQALPLARIKKIMKLDEDVKMISAEAPVLFAKAAEIFIHELTLRAWAHTEDNKRRTLQRNDIAMAISKSDQFDFLIDIVPRNETIISKPRRDPPKASPTTETITQHQQASLQNSQPQIVLQPYGQLVQQSSAATGSSGNSSGQQPVLLQQLMTPQSNEITQLPLQLTAAQLNMIRLQMQNNSNQPIIIQAQQQGQHLIQVSSQGQQQPQQQVYLQVATSDNDS